MRPELFLATVSCPGRMIDCVFGVELSTMVVSGGLESRTCGV
jgi:hypothetical protein